MSGSFAKHDLQLKASYGSLPPCIYDTGKQAMRAYRTRRTDSQREDAHVSYANKHILVK